MASFEDFVSKIPIIGAFAESDEHEALQRQFQEMANAYKQYGGMAMDARKQQMGSQLGMFGPVQQYLSGMLPGIKPFDVQGALDKLNSVQMPVDTNPRPGLNSLIEKLSASPPQGWAQMNASKLVPPTGRYDVFENQPGWNPISNRRRLGGSPGPGELLFGRG